MYVAAEFPDRLQVHYVVRSALLNFPDLVTVQVEEVAAGPKHFGDLVAQRLWPKRFRREPGPHAGLARRIATIHREMIRSWVALVYS